MAHPITNESRIDGVQQFLEMVREHMPLKSVPLGDFYRVLQAERLRKERVYVDDWTITDYRSADGSLVAYRWSVVGHSPQFYLKTN